MAEGPSKPGRVSIPEPKAGAKLTPEEIKALRSALTEGDRASRLRAAKLLESVDRSWVGGFLVDRLLAEGDDEVRAVLRGGILRRKDRHSARALGKWSRQRDVARRKEAVQMLGNIGGKSAATALKNFVRDRDKDVVLRVIATAGQLADGQGVPVLTQCIKQHPEHLLEIIDALGKTAHPKGAKLLITFLHRRKYKEQKPAAIQAFRALDGHAIPPLIDALDARDYRQYAASVLRTITGERMSSRDRWIQWWRKNKKRYQGR